MKYRKILRCLAVLLIILSAGLPGEADALEDGAYILSNITYYVNPDTGASDDGGDTSTGEGMCRNTTGTESLYEIEGGEHYAVLRIKMISFISNVRFDVQQIKGDANSYQSVAYTVEGENEEENTRDFKIKIPSGDVLIKPSFFVGPMNRDVTYFIGLDLETAQKDDGSFAAFNQSVISAETDASESPAENTDSLSEPEREKEDQSDQEKYPLQREEIEESTNIVDPDGEENKEKNESETISQEKTDTEVTGIQEFSTDGELQKSEEKADSQKRTPLILGGTLLAVIAAGIVTVLKRIKTESRS